jgi:hypothetical protein
MIIFIRKYLIHKKAQIFSILNMVKNYTKNIYYAVCLFFYNLYVDYLKWRTFKLINKATKSVYKLMPILGKDPNYVAPPPPPPARQPQEPKRKTLQPHYVPSWVEESFRNPKKHPLYYGGAATLVPEPSFCAPSEVSVNVVVDNQPSELSPTIADGEFESAEYKGSNAD